MKICVRTSSGSVQTNSVTTQLGRWATSMSQPRTSINLVEEGVTFTHAYCQSPICTPSRGSFLTGMYPSAVHVNGNGNEYFPDSPPLVTRLLADAGYDCGLIGKLHLASAHRRIEPRVNDGYRYWQYSHAPRDDWETGHDYADWVRSKGHILGELTKSIDGVPAELHQTTWCAEKTIEFIQTGTGRAVAGECEYLRSSPPVQSPQNLQGYVQPGGYAGAPFPRELIWNSSGSWKRLISSRRDDRQRNWISAARSYRSLREQLKQLQQEGAMPKPCKRLTTP